MQTYEFNAAPRQIDAVGDFFRYEEGTAGGASDGIRVRADGLDLGTFYPGDWLRVAAPYRMWQIVPVTPTAVGLVRIGNGMVGSNRVAGSVRIVQDGILQAQETRQFTAAVMTPDDNELLHLAMLSGMGATVAVRKITIACGAGSSVAIARATTSGTRWEAGAPGKAKNYAGPDSTAKAAGALFNPQSIPGDIAEGPAPAELGGWDVIARAGVGDGWHPTEIVFDTPVLMQASTHVLAVALYSRSRAVVTFEYDEA